MEAPDKIYIHEASAHELAEPVLKEYHIEYIRKDALLEWLKELKAQSLKLREEVYGDVFYGAQIAILEETIYKIESL